VSAPEPKDFLVVRPLPDLPASSRRFELLLLCFQAKAVSEIFALATQDRINLQGLQLDRSALEDHGGWTRPSRLVNSIAHSIGTFGCHPNIDAMEFF